MVKKISITFLGILLIGFIIPQSFRMPVIGANIGDYNQNTYWYSPWGSSGTHKGVDIFTKKEGVGVVATTSGLVLATGSISKGGNFVLILGPKWRLHYYAHLQSIATHRLDWVKSGNRIGTVGTTGNAIGKQPHIHYSILTLIPYIWRIDKSPHGWKKMLYLNPIPFLNDSLNEG